MGILNQGSGKAKGQAGDPVLTRLVDEDTVSWVRKPHLRNLYLLLVPAAIGIEITSGFDSQLINALQIVPSWIKCKIVRIHSCVVCVNAIRLQPPGRVAQGHHCRSVFSWCYSLASFHSQGGRLGWSSRVHYVRLDYHDHRGSYPGICAEW